MERTQSTYPNDPISEKDMTKYVYLCTKDKGYKTFSNNIVNSCSITSETPFKVQKIAIDKIKEIIKSKPKNCSS